MKLKACLTAFLIFSHFHSYADENKENSPLLQSKIFSTNRPENIQVLIENGVNQALLEVKGPHYIYNPYDGSKIANGILAKRFIIHPIENGLKWGESFPGVHQIYIVPRSESTSILVNGIQYDGAVAIYQVGDKISIINDVDIEQFIKATICPKFSYPLDKEAMASVAIIARTNAYYLAKENQNKFWHVDAKKMGYLGSSMIPSHTEIETAINQTKHLILTSKEGLPFPAKWTEHCAGKTASYNTIFRQESAAPKGVEAPLAQLDRKETFWTFQMPKKKIASLFSLSDLNELDLFIDKASGKTYGVKLKGKNGDKVVSFLTFQKLIGKELLLSNDFAVTSKSDSLVFSGYGKGDGVGLCLFSASTLSQSGEDAVTILKKFYPETNLVNLSASPEFDKKTFEGKR